MKFFDYLFAPGVRPISITLGVLLGAGTALFTDWMVGCFVGAIAVLVLSLLIPTVVYLQDIPYNRIKKALPKPFIFDQRVQFLISGKQVVSGYFILTDDRMIFLSLDKGEHRMELSRTEVSRIQSDDRFNLHIYLDHQQFIQVQTPACRQIFQMLTEKGWC